MVSRVPGLLLGGQDGGFEGLLNSLFVIAKLVEHGSQTPGEGDLRSSGLWEKSKRKGRRKESSSL